MWIFKKSKLIKFNQFQPNEPILTFQLPKIKFEKYNVAMTPDENHVTQPTVNIKDENDLIVRGRIFDQSKPETFNQVIRNLKKDIPANEMNILTKIRFFVIQF